MEKSSEPAYTVDNARFDLVNSKYAICTICNVLMNLVVLEPKLVKEDDLFFTLLKFIMGSLPSLTNSGKDDCL